MKSFCILAFAMTLLGGCAIVPVGYNGDGYYRGQGYYRGDGHYRGQGYYRGDGYRGYGYRDRGG